MRLRSLPLHGILSDFLLWIILISLIVSLYSIIISMGKKSGETKGKIVTLYFNDANQLTTGSPVNFIGTDIGYVTSVKPQENQVEVKFQIYDKNITLPFGTHFTIEFNGLAGAKTLEALPPSKTEQLKQLYISDNPIRIRDVMDTQMILAKALEFSAKNTAHTLRHIQGEDTLIKKLEFFKNRLTTINSTLVYAFESAHHQANKIHNTVMDVENFINSFDSTVKELEYIISPQFFKTNAMTSLRQVSVATEKIYHNFTEVQNRHRIEVFHKKIASANHGVQKFKTVFQNRSYSWLFYPLEQFNVNINKFNNFLYQVENGFYKKLSADYLAKCKEKTACWARVTKNWTNKTNTSR